MDTPRTLGFGRAAARALVRSATAALVILAATACGGGGQGGAPKTATSAPVATGVGGVPGAAERATLRGTLTLDGAPLESKFLGVRVIRDGLATPRQYTVPAVTQGRYEIQVVADAEVRRCGAPGAEVLLWAYVGDAYVYSSKATSWPGAGATATFGASFSTAARAGASKPVTEFKGHLFGRDGSGLPGGTVVEAFVGDVRCGVTSLRDDFQGIYALAVAGPESLSGCAEGARLTFRINGAPAVETALNDLVSGTNRAVLDLTVK